MSEPDIPKNAVIPCPATSFKARFASACVACEHFRGVVDTQPDAGQPVSAAVRYRVLCAHPIARRFELIEQ